MFITLQTAKTLNQSQLDTLYRQSFSPALYKLFKIANLDVHFQRAEGLHLWDTEGNQYLDFIGGFGTLNLGHNPKRVIDALNEHFTKPNLIGESINIYNGILANNISELTGGALPVCHFTNSGAETVEEAIKLAMMYKGKGVILYCTNGYHGKTLGAMSALGDSAKENYTYFNKTFVEIPFGDFEALEKAGKKHKVAAFLVEPLQGEGGMVVPPEGYFKRVREFCDKEDIILILDEIQTGLGRCGTMFLYEQLGIVPDILCLAKALSGGVIPVGCMAAKAELWEATYGKLKNATLLGTTFGGNTFACVSAIETLTAIREEKLYERARDMGEYTISRLNVLKGRHKLITDVRGKGLMIGVEMGHLKKLPGKTAAEFMVTTIVSKMLREHRILCSFSGNNPAVLRVEPPLIVGREEIDYFVDSLDKVLADEKGELTLAVDSLVLAGKGILNYMADK